MPTWSDVAGKSHGCACARGRSTPCRSRGLEEAEHGLLCLLSSWWGPPRLSLLSLESFEEEGALYTPFCSGSSWNTRGNSLGRVVLSPFPRNTPNFYLPEVAGSWLGMALARSLSLSLVRFPEPTLRLCSDWPCSGAAIFQQMQWGSILEGYDTFRIFMVPT